MSELTRQSFENDVEVRWCPGCGDYAILATVLKVLPQLGVAPENTVFISGIGCSSRFPYYLNTYGFHTIHGRAPTIATGLKLARPELSVWIVTGDGDGLSIGGNHLLHLMRRNLNINVLLLNNQIYGLTKGQYSPTSQTGQVTKSSPMGAIESPLDPVAIALAANGTFIGRGIDIDGPGLQQTLLAAAQHQGTSFVEIYQNCNVFNDGAFAHFSDRGYRADRTVCVQPGEPLIFGEKREKGLIWQGAQFKVGAAEEATVFSNDNKAMAYELAALKRPDFPVAIGTFWQKAVPCYEEQMSKPNTLNNSEILKQLMVSKQFWVR
jgi:2-oxoglutarate ferredoxin oxidoreductase subunit beta